MLGDTIAQPRKQISIPLQKSTSKPSEPHKENFIFIKKRLLSCRENTIAQKPRRENHMVLELELWDPAIFCVKELRSKPKPPILDTTLKASARHPPEGKSR